MKPISSVTTKVLSALDNEASLYPIWVKDFADNSVRTYMEYNRGGKGAHHAGRERAFEEFSTMFVWLGGRKVLNRYMLDPLIQRYGLDPKVDMMLLLKNHKQQVPGWIKANKPAYIVANLVRFAIGTVIPVVAIAWGIPTINQAITRHKVAEEERRKKINAGGKQPVSWAAGRNFPVSNPARRLVNNQGKMPTIPTNRKPAGLSAHAWSISPFPAGYGISPYPPPSQLWTGYGGNAGKRLLQNVRFGQASPLQTVANYINNEFYSNVAIDLGITGGRLAKARNWVDFMEVGIRESSIILFIYFLGDYVKGHLRRFFDNSYNTVTDLTFDSIQWLKTQKITPSQWQEEVRFLESLSPRRAFETISKRLNTRTGRFDQNPILELARLQRKIPVISSHDAMPAQSFQNIFGVLAPTRSGKPRYVVDPRQFLDLEDIKGALIKGERKPDWIEQGWLRLKNALPRTPGKTNPFAAKPQPGIVSRLLKAVKPKSYFASLQTCLARTWRYKGVALIISYAVSNLFSAWLSPMFQHWLTKTLTGSVDFPGTRSDV